MMRIMIKTFNKYKLLPYEFQKTIPVVQVFMIEVKKLFMEIFFHHDERQIQPVTQSGNEGSKT